LKFFGPLFFFCFILELVVPAIVEAEETSEIGSDIFGKRGGYIHGFLSVAEQWTDNLFYTSDDTESDFVTFVSPGIRLSLPGTKEELLTVAGSTTAPGGMSFGRMNVGGGRSFQAYLSYTPEFEFYAENKDEDITTHLANGLLSWRLRSGLALELIDQFTVGYQEYDEGLSISRDGYTSNLVAFDVLYPVGSKLDLRVDFQNYQIAYDATEDADRDRTDRNLSTYVFYKVRSKSSVFVQYQQIDIEYDLDSGKIDDSVDQQWFGGFHWDLTAKSSGAVKIGNGEKKFDDPALGSMSDFVFEAQIKHNFTPKTAASLMGYRRQEETTIKTIDYTLTQFVGLNLAQKMTYRIQATLDLDYTLKEYKGGVVITGDARQRDDQTYSVTAGLNYAPRGWLSFGLEYGYQERDSNFNAFDYTANRVLLRITGAI
jgi:hypothetical protein